MLMRCVQNLNILESTDRNLLRLLLVSLCWFLHISKSSNLLQQTEAALLSFTRWLTSELVFWSFIASCVHARISHLHVKRTSQRSLRLVCSVVVVIDRVWSRLVGSVAGLIFMRWSVCRSDKQPLLPHISSDVTAQLPSNHTHGQNQ